MVIQLPENLAIPIREAVRRGRYASLDEAMVDAAELLVERLNVEQTATRSPTAAHPDDALAARPIWEIATEIRGRIPAEEWAKLPADGAEQLDHYLYGSPKRPQP